MKDLRKGSIVWKKATAKKIGNTIEGESVGIVAGKFEGGVIVDWVGEPRAFAEREDLLVQYYA